MARFLVIEDDNTFRQLMAMTLQGAGHKVVEAATGREAAAALGRHAIDVVVTDIVMPEDGIAQIVELRRQYATVPFMIVSGLNAESPQSRGVAELLGACRIMPKPFRLPDFLRAAEEIGPRPVEHAQE